MQSRMQIFLHLIGFPKKANAKSLDRKTLSLADQGLSAAPHFLKTIYFDLAPIINLYAIGKLVLTIFSEKTLYIEKKK